MEEALGRTRYYATMALSTETKSGTCNRTCTSLAAIDIDEVFRQRMLFDHRRNLTRLTERADAAGLVAGDSFRVRRLPGQLGELGELFGSPGAQKKLFLARLHYVRALSVER